MSSMNKISALREGLGNSRTRALVSVIIIVAVISIIIGYIEFKKITKRNLLASRAKISTVPSVSSIPGSKDTSRQIVELQKKQNAELASEALKKHGAAIPTITRTTYVGDNDIDLSKINAIKNNGDVSGVSGKSGVFGGDVNTGKGNRNKANSLEKDRCSVSSLKAERISGKKVVCLRCLGCSDKQLKAAGYTDKEIQAGDAAFEYASKMKNKKEQIQNRRKVKPDSNSVNSMDAEIAKLRAAQNKLGQNGVMQDKISDMQSNMDSQAGDLFSSWTPVPSQKYHVTGYKPQKLNGNGLSVDSVVKDQDIIKAGSVLFAVLDTGINSDEPSPIMATIISGKLKGSKVIGSFTRKGKVVVVQFSRLSVPTLSKTVSINAYAIDPNTARTSMADSVNSHYLLRYGSLLASAFIEGVGQAVQNSGSSLQVSATNGVVLTHPAMSVAQQAMVGLGKVGEKVGSNLNNIMNTPPTVKVEAGASIGLLIMSDLGVPKAKQEIK